MLIFLAILFLGMTLLFWVAARITAAVLVASAGAALAVLAGLALLFNLGAGFFVLVLILLPLAVWIGKWEGNFINRLFHW